jgi:hypothetical protein
MKSLRVTLVLGTVLTVAASTSAFASVNPVWQAAKNAALPTQASGLYNGNLSVLSCPAQGDCVAGGIYQNASGNSYGLLLNEVNGVWRDPTTVTPPSNAVVADGVSLYAVSCGAVGNCSGVGTYADSAQNQRSFVVDEVGGVWQKALEVTLPANASTNSQVSDLHSIACSSVGNCSAVGAYSVSAGTNLLQEAFVVNEIAGHWQSAKEITLPAGANFNPFAELSQVSCASVGNCSAAGSYIDASNVDRALVATEVKGTWRAGTALLLPTNASQYAGATLSEVSCASAGDCAVAGTYNATGGTEQLLVDSETNGSWARATEIQAPANAAASPHVLLYGFNGVDCPSVGNCAAGGQYQDKSGNYQGFFVNEVNGHWLTASELSLPAGAVQAGKNGGVVSISCIAPGNCSAGAAYLNASGSYEALTVNEVNNTWAAGLKITLPSGATTVGEAGGVYAVSCQRTGSCEAVGSYETASGNYLGFTDTAS